MTPSHLVGLLAALAALAVVAVACARRAPPPARAPAPAVTVERRDFHGWPAVVLGNGRAELTIVPQLAGRIMQLALVEPGGARGPFWSHPALGPTLAGDENGWINFGGDKAWPAPQSRWEAIVGRGWPPPHTFDAAAFDAEVGADGRVRLLSPVDPAYGLRVRRTIELDEVAPVATVETCYQKVSGPSVRVGVWTITQLASPERLFLRLPERSAFPGGFAQRMPDPPRALAVDGRLLSLERDPAAKTMIVSDGEAMLWVGDGPDLLIETLPEAHDPASEWPDGAHAQIYTSSDQALPYVELELMSPLRDLAPGAQACLRVRYTLKARAEANAHAEAKRVLGP